MNRRELITGAAALLAYNQVKAGRVLRGRPSGGGGSIPFTWCPALDFATVPWYMSAGAWGSQYTMPEAAPPVTTNTENPTNLSQFQAALVSGNRINIGAGVTIDCGGGLQAEGETISDLDIVIDPAGALLNFRMGSFGSTQCNYQRIRYRGPTVGSYSGGQLHQAGFVISGNASSSVNDVIVDGVGMTGGASDDITATNAFMVQSGTTSSRRLNVVNNRLASGGEGYIGDMGDTIFAGNSMLTALTNPEPVEDESWGTRVVGYLGTSHIMAFNDIRSSVPGRTNVFHRARIHPGVNGVGHWWLANNVFVDLVEARMLWVNAAAGSLAGWLESFMTNGNAYYAEGAGLGFSTESSIYNRFTNETFFSALSLSDASLVVASAIAGPPPPGISTVKVTSGNAYNGTQTPPAWLNGDPSTLNWDI